MYMTATGYSKAAKNFIELIANSYRMTQLVWANSLITLQGDTGDR